MGRWHVRHVGTMSRGGMSPIHQDGCEQSARGTEGKVEQLTCSHAYALRLCPEPRIPPTKDVFPVAIEDARPNLEQ
jgi:hypothetical protein